MRTVIIVAVLLTSCAAIASKPRYAALAAQANDSQPVNSDDSWWKPIFFKSINERARVANLPALSKISLPKNDLEVRVWHGFGITLLEGFVLRRLAGQWAAIDLAGYDKRRPRSKYQIKLQTPKSGWKGCWKRLEEVGLSTLPDASQLGKEPIYPDAMSYVVEYNAGGNYRTYHYTSPETNDREEAKQMVKIGQIISEEFDLPELRPQQ